MPEFLKQWLQSLTDEQAEVLWIYLDETRLSECDIIEIICESHPAVVSKISTQE